MKQEEAKEKLINSAFTAFQLGAGGDKRFGEYLESLGLSERKQEPLPQVTKEEAMAKGMKIREKIRKMKKKA